jgi:serine/threonine protein kinase
MPKPNKLDLYSVLEVSPRARAEVIDAAYKVLMKEYHPDKGGSNRVATTLNEARDTLMDPKKRSDYDSKLLDMSGKIVGNYRVLEVIAEGGFGRTYRGEHIMLGTPVCIKHGHKISPQDEEILMEEAKAIWDLRHYGIPAVRDLLKMDDGSPVLITSYVAGPTLEQIIKKIGRIEPEDISWITTRTLNVLKYLHYHGVVHGDVKPQNIIIQPDIHGVVMVDYGLSAIRPTNNEPNKGYTPGFAAPEQENGNTIVPETDFYGLGMTLIYALGGDVLRKRVPEDTPDPFCNFIKRLIVRDVLSRPSWDKEDLVETFEKVREQSFGRIHSGFKKIRGFS